MLFRFCKTINQNAEKIDIDPKYVSRIETGISNSSLKTVEKISQIMNVDVVRLFKPDEINEQIISKYQ